ncbi:MAG: ABC transporter permease subunit [Thermoplasmata archaeon]
MAGAVGVFFALGAAGAYSIPFIIQNLPSGFGPLEISLEFTTYTYIIGFGIALGLGLVRAYPPRRDPTVSRKRLRTRLSWLWRWPLYAFTSGYVAAIRGTPFLVQLFIVWNVMIFTVPHLLFLGWDVNYWAGFIALLINTAGYQVEVFRGGFQSVGAGQIEGAKAVGLSRVQTFFRVTLPQTIRLMSLPLTNEWISNFKTATILSFIGVFEVYDWAHTNIALYDAQPIAAFVMLCIFYVGVNVTLSRVVTYIERVRRIPGLGSPDLNVDMSKRLIGVDVRGSRPGSKPRGSPGSAAPQLASRAHPAALERSSR